MAGPDDRIFHALLGRCGLPLITGNSLTGGSCFSGAHSSVRIGQHMATSMTGRPREWRPTGGDCSWLVKKQVGRGRPALYLVKDVRILCGLGIPILSLCGHSYRDVWEPGISGQYAVTAPPTLAYMDEKGAFTRRNGAREPLSLHRKQICFPFSLSPRSSEAVASVRQLCQFKMAPANLLLPYSALSDSCFCIVSVEAIGSSESHTDALRGYQLGSFFFSKPIWPKPTNIYTT